MVELIILKRTCESKSISEASSKITDLGNSSPFIYESAYFPLLELISRILFSKEKVKGCSGSDFNTSNSNFAGIATFVMIVDSIKIFDDRVVSKSDDVIVRSLLFISNKKLSKIGSVLFVFKIDPSICRFLSNSEEDIMNFI